jgi:hypothetical protein
VGLSTCFSFIIHLSTAARAYLAQDRTKLNIFTFLSVYDFGEENKKALAGIP